MDPRDMLVQALLRVYRVDHSEPLAGLLEAVLAEAIQLAGGHKGSLYLTDDRGLSCVVAQDEEGNPISGLAGPLAFSVARECLNSGEPVHVPVAQAQGVASSLVAGPPAVSVVCIPIRAREDVFGVVYVDQGSADHGFRDREREILLRFGEGVGTAIRQAEAYDRLSRRLELVEDADRFCGIVGRDPSMRRIFRQVQQIAAGGNDRPVLIRGESGTGKELVARALHLSGQRGRGRFVPVSCAELPSDLLESQLFGRARAVSVGTAPDSGGLFGAAAGGTIFLDQIGELDPDLQARLLRVLQAQESSPADVWVILATNQDLTARIEGGRFGRELYERIRTTTIAVPPLRKRTADIPLLISAFSGGVRLVLGSEVDALLRRYSWPGNVGELKNLVDQLRVFASGSAVTAADLPPEIVGAPGVVPAPAARDLGRLEREEVIQNFLGSRDLEQVKGAAVEAAVRAQLADQLLAGAPALRINKSALAEKLGVTRKTVQSLLKRHRIDPERMVAELGE